MHDALQNAGYEVHTASNGREALDLLERLHEPVLLLDLLMPVMNGWEVLDELRRHDRRLPVIVFSAAADRRQALEAGATLFLTKPARLQQLLEAIEQVSPRKLP
jgi:CheY-like chemotaxis protein